MSTDETESAFTDEQRAAATFALARSLHGNSADHEEWDYYRKHVDIALDAAAGIAPPAPSADREKLAIHYCPAHGDLVLDHEGNEVTPRSHRCREAHSVAEIAALAAPAPVTDRE